MEYCAAACSVCGGFFVVILFPEAGMIRYVKRLACHNHLLIDTTSRGVAII